MSRPGATALVLSLTLLAHPRGVAASDTPTPTSSEHATSDGRASDATAAEEHDDGWIVWVLLGGALAAGVGIAVGVIVSQDALEPPVPGTLGTVELLRF